MCLNLELRRSNALLRPAWKTVETDRVRTDGSLSRAAVCVTITRAVTLISFALFGVPPGLGLPPATAQQTPPAPQIWTVPEIGALPNDAASQQIRRGRDLITATYAHVGPEVADPAKRFAGNNLACANCHLEAGTKKFGIPLFGLFWMFPEYTARDGGEITLEDRLNNCMMRSMNGRPMPNDSPEMQAIIAYIKFLSPRATPVERNLM